jgi:hypothetical protein
MLIQRHDYLRDLLANCLCQATTPAAVKKEVPILLPSRASQANAANTNSHSAARVAGPASNVASHQDHRMDIRVQGLRGVGVIDDIDVRITHLDCESFTNSANGHKTVEALFEEHHVRPKRQKYEEAVHALRHTFVPFVVSTDGVLCEAAKTYFKELASKTAEKWGMQGAGQKGVVTAFLRAKLAVAIVKGASYCVRGDRTRRSRYADEQVVSVDAAHRAELRFLFSSQGARLPG